MCWYISNNTRSYVSSICLNASRAMNGKNGPVHFPRDLQACKYCKLITLSLIFSPIILHMWICIDFGIYLNNFLVSIYRLSRFSNCIPWREISQSRPSIHAGNYTVHHYSALIIQNIETYTEELCNSLLYIVREIRKRLQWAGRVIVMGKQECKQNFGGETCYETATRKTKGVMGG
jgi:hypothetical protein